RRELATALLRAPRPGRARSGGEAAPARVAVGAGAPRARGGAARRCAASADGDTRARRARQEERLAADLAGMREKLEQVGAGQHADRFAVTGDDDCVRAARERREDLVEGC